jgi:hypothetical protein
MNTIFAGVAGSVIFLIIFLVWWVKGLTTKREIEQEDEYEELTGVIDVKRNIKDKLRDDPGYADRVRDAFNDKSG